MLLSNCFKCNSPATRALEYCAGRSMVPQRAEIRPVPTHSDEDQGGSDRQCRLIQHFRHQIQLLVARPAPAEPNRYVATLECLGIWVNWSNTVRLTNCSPLRARNGRK